MLYLDFDSLCQAASQTSLDDTESLKRLGELFKVYWDAKNSPPYGIIGVGAITYAESVLVAYQLNEPDNV
jgi:hypothetical protein